MPSYSSDRMGKIMGFVLYVGAARAEASELQLERLRAELVPALEEYRHGRLSRDAVKQVVQAAMGKDWTPSGEWKLWIDKMEGRLD